MNASWKKRLDNWLRRHPFVNVVVLSSNMATILVANRKHVDAGSIAFAFVAGLPFGLIMVFVVQKLRR